MKARVSWILASAGGRQSLPTGTQYSTISKFPEDGPEWPNRAWSVVVDFSPPPSVQGNPSIGEVRFLFEEAPQERLCAGRGFELYEGGRHVAHVELLGD
jgi:hypothetical protein